MVVARGVTRVLNELLNELHRNRASFHTWMSPSMLCAPSPAHPRAFAAIRAATAFLKLRSASFPMSPSAGPEPATSTRREPKAALISAGCARIDRMLL